MVCTVLALVEPLLHTLALLQAISAWEDGLASTELLAMPASLTAAAEKAQQFMAARCEAGLCLCRFVCIT